MKDYSKIIALAKETEETLLMKDKQIFELKQNHLNLRKSLFLMRNKSNDLSRIRNQANKEERKAHDHHHLAKSAFAYNNIKASNDNSNLKESDSKSILCKLQSAEVSEEEDQKDEKENLIIEQLKAIYVEERTQLEINLLSLKEELDIAVGTIQDLQEKLKFYENFQTDNLKIFNCLYDELNQKQERIQSLLENIEEITKRFDIQNEALSELKISEQRKEEKIQELLNVIESLDENLKSQQEIYEKEKGENYEHRKNTLKKVEFLSCELENYQEKLHDLKTVQEEKMTLNDKLEKLQKDFDNIMLEKQNQIFELKQQMSKSRRNFLGLGVQVNVAHSKNENISGNIESLTKEIADLKEKNSCLLKENEMFKKENSQKKKYEEQIKYLKQEILNLKELLAEHEEISNHNNDIVETKKEEISNDNKQNNTEENINSNKNETEIPNKNKQFRNLNSIFEESSAKYHPQFCDFSDNQNENEELKSKIDLLMEKEEENNNTIYELQKQNHQLQEKLLNFLNLENEMKSLTSAFGEKELLYQQAISENQNLKEREKIHLEKIKNLEDFLNKTNKNNAFTCCCSQKGDCIIF